MTTPLVWGVHPSLMYVPLHFYFTSSENLQLHLSWLSRFVDYLDRYRKVGNVFLSSSHIFFCGLFIAVPWGANKLLPIAERHAEWKDIPGIASPPPTPSTSSTPPSFTTGETMSPCEVQPPGARGPGHAVLHPILPVSTPPRHLPPPPASSWTIDSPHETDVTMRFSLAHITCPLSHSLFHWEELMISDDTHFLAVVVISGILFC